MKFYETKEFRKLEREWNKKLETPYTPLNPFYYHPQTRYNETVAYNRQEYYLRLSQHVSQTRFKSSRDRLILRARSEGFKIKEILAKLKLKGFHVHRQTVRFVIRKYEQKWQLRHWTPQQLTSNRVSK